MKAKFIKQIGHNILVVQFYTVSLYIIPGIVMSIELSGARTGKVGMGSAIVTPEVDVAAAKTTTTTGQRKDTPDAGSFPAPGAPDAAEQVSLDAPSKLRQFKALMRKHYAAYKRNKELTQPRMMLAGNIVGLVISSIGRSTVSLCMSFVLPHSGASERLLLLLFLCYWRWTRRTA